MGNDETTYSIIYDDFLISSDAHDGLGSMCQIYPGLLLYNNHTYLR